MVLFTFIAALDMFGTNPGRQLFLMNHQPGKASLNKNTSQQGKNIMKKAIITSILGIAASTIAAYGDGQIYFDNYASIAYQTDRVVYNSNASLAPVGDAGKGVGDANVEVQLFYALGTYTTQSAFNAVAKSGVTTFIDPAVNPNGGYGIAPYGFYRGPVQVISGWSSGPVTFQIEAWETAGTYKGGGTYDTSLLTGLSALWQETGAAAGGGGIQPISLQCEYFAHVPGMVMSLEVPEPTTMAFAGVGVLSLFAIARRWSI